jgi:RNA polymerase sigma factor (sigma-70 family)
VTVTCEWLAERFEENRKHLRAVAYRMLGSLNDAEDAVQETWLRLSRSEASGLQNLEGWLTTVIARVCLDMLRSRKVQGEELRPSEAEVPSPARDPEQESLLADSVGLALLVVLGTLPPAERLAFVLHDMFGLPFEAIAPIVDRSPTAARQLASRARRRVQGAPAVPPVDLARQRAVVEAFLAATRGGHFEALLAVLDPDVVVRADAVVIRGAEKVAKQAVLVPRSTSTLGQPALVNGSVGIVVAPHGRLATVLCFKLGGGKIVEIDVLTERGRLAELKLGILPNGLVSRTRNS